MPPAGVDRRRERRARSRSPSLAPAGARRSESPRPVVRHRRARSADDGRDGGRTTRPRPSRTGPRSGRRGVVQSRAGRPRPPRPPRRPRKIRRRPAGRRPSSPTGVGRAGREVRRHPPAIQRGEARVGSARQGDLAQAPPTASSAWTPSGPRSTWARSGSGWWARRRSASSRSVRPGAGDRIVAGPDPDPRAGLEDAQGRLRQAVADPGDGNRHRARHRAGRPESRTASRSGSPSRWGSSASRARSRSTLGAKQGRR